MYWDLGFLRVFLCAIVFSLIIVKSLQLCERRQIVEPHKYCLMRVIVFFGVCFLYLFCFSQVEILVKFPTRGRKGNSKERERFERKIRKKYYHITLGVLRTKIKRGVFVKIVCKMINEKNYYIKIFFNVIDQTRNFWWAPIFCF